MNAATQIFALVAALVHIWAFVCESVLFDRPAVQRMFLGHADVPQGVLLWAFNQGFYNLFVAAGAVGGVWAYRAGETTAGQALVLYTCAFMALAGLVLFVSDRRLWRGALGQSAAPLIALVAAAC